MLNINPSVLVVSAAKETAVEQVLNPLVIPTTASNIVTPSLRSLTLVTEPLIDGAAGAGAKPWYMFANPMLSGATIVYGGLEGNTGPRITMDAPFNLDGIQLKIVHDFYAAVADHRFAFKNPGVA